MERGPTAASVDRRHSEDHGKRAGEQLNMWVYLTHCIAPRAYDLAFSISSRRCAHEAAYPAGVGLEGKRYLLRGE